MLACYRYQFLFRSRQISPHFELLRWFRFNADHEHRRGLPHVAVHSEVRSPRGAASGARQVELAVSLAPLPNLVLVPEPDQKVPWFRREPPLFTNLLWRGLDPPYRFRKRSSHAPPPGSRAWVLHRPGWFTKQRQSHAQIRTGAGDTRPVGMKGGAGRQACWTSRLGGSDWKVNWTKIVIRYPSQSSRLIPLGV